MNKILIFIASILCVIAAELAHMDWNLDKASEAAVEMATY